MLLAESRRTSGDRDYFYHEEIGGDREYRKEIANFKDLQGRWLSWR